MIKTLKTLTACLFLLITYTSCEKKACDCKGLQNQRLSYVITKSDLPICNVVEDFKFSSENLVTVYRYYKDTSGFESDSEIQAIASWELVDETNCKYKVHDLVPSAYSFPTVDESCNNNVTLNSFFYNLQFGSSITLNITDQTCNELVINGNKFTY